MHSAPPSPPDPWAQLRTNGDEGDFPRPTCICGSGTLPGKGSTWGRAVGHGHFSFAAQTTFSLFYYCRKLYLEENITALCSAGSAGHGKQAGGMGAAGRRGQSRGKPHPRQRSARAGGKLASCHFPVIFAVLETRAGSWKHCWKRRCTINFNCKATLKRQ